MEQLQVGPSGLYTGMAIRLGTETPEMSPGIGQDMSIVSLSFSLLSKKTGMAELISKDGERKSTSVVCDAL